MADLRLQFPGGPGEEVIVVNAVRTVYRAALAAADPAERAILEPRVRRVLRRLDAQWRRACAQLDAEAAEDAGVQGGTPPASAAGASMAHGCAALAPAVGPAPASSEGGAGSAAQASAARPADPLLRPRGQELPAAGGIHHAQRQKGGHTHG